MPHTHHDLPRLSQGQALLAGLTQLVKQPGLNLAVILVVIFVSLLPSSSLVLQNNLPRLVGHLEDTNELFIYLTPATSAELATNLAAQLRQNLAVKAIKVLTPGDGMRHLVQATGLEEVFGAVQENPLPYVLVSRLKLAELTKAEVLGLVASLRKLPVVTKVDLDLHLLDQSYYWLQFGQELLRLVVWCLIGGSLLTLSVVGYGYARVGFSQLPNKRVVRYQTFWQGLFGVVGALGWLKLILLKLSEFGIEARGLGPNYSWLILGGGVWLYWFWASVALRICHIDSHK